MCCELGTLTELVCARAMTRRDDCALRDEFAVKLPDPTFVYIKHQQAE